ncbi:response regulator transcription factor [Halomonas sp. DP5Y7-2]|uniref:response regulator transcription factor n=1 Tax=Halomonas sp. DP5Y7-2 TaxID=2859076 RepID=UPI001C991BDC|nr:response regulator transcription factor [Halomonas sp. DP5Y7-2]MBY5983935.1 response regulator transcription factor [Halomonas sp. DP5Y7-2]
MSASQQASIVRLITHPNVQSQLFTHHLSQVLDCEVSTLAPEAVPSLQAELARTPDQSQLWLLDADQLSLSDMHHCHELKAQYPEILLAAFNLADQEQAAELLASLHLQGIFYRRDELDNICKGIIQLLDGALWMSRPLLQQMFEYFRRQQFNTYRPVAGLTQRELEILGFIGNGASNQDIASQLFLSEHTVKSHLYNIFKKIKVHHRTEAAQWARKHLGIPPPMSKGNQRDRQAQP